MELYILFVSLYGETRVNNVCENLFWTPYVREERVIELCEASVWKNSFPLSYNK